MPAWLPVPRWPWRQGSHCPLFLQAPPAEWDRGLLLGLPSELLTLSSPFGKREGGREGEERQRKKHSPSDLRPSQRVFWPLLLPQGIHTTTGHFLLIDSFPSARPSYLLHRSLHRFPTDSPMPHLSPTAAFPSIFSPETTFLPISLLQSPLASSLPRPTLSLYPDPTFPLGSLLPPTLLHRPARMLSPQKNSLGQPSSFYPHSPHPCTALCFPFPNLISYPPSFPGFLLCPQRPLFPISSLLHP